MKILLSAYACEPGKGSEQGVGWHWAIQLACLGHDVTVITRANNRTCIEKALAGVRADRLRFRYFDLPPLARIWKRGPHAVHLYYWLWQAGAYRFAKRLVIESRFDVVHHLTFGVFRQPSFMGRHGLPLIVGPIGGGETTPLSLRRSFPFGNRLQERLRDLANVLTRFDPFVCAMLNDATLILCKTNETLHLLPDSCQSRCRVHLEIGLEPERVRAAVEDGPSSPAFLYAGRLVYWKGVHLALRAFAEFRKQNSEATLSVIGQGPDEAWLRSLAHSLGIRESVQWLGWMAHETLWQRYSSYTALLFPSLHDSSGNVLLEAMGQGLPIICIDANGPGAVVPSLAGIKVGAAGRGEAAVVHELARAMQQLTDNPDLRARMARNALQFANVNTWRHVVSSAYAYVEDALRFMPANKLVCVGGIASKSIRTQAPNGRDEAIDPAKRSPASMRSDEDSRRRNLQMPDVQH